MWFFNFQNLVRTCQHIGGTPCIRNQKDSDSIVASSGKLSMFQCMHPDSSILQSSSGLPKFIMRKRLENSNRQRQLLFHSEFLKNSWTIPKPSDLSDRRCYIADFFGQGNQMAPFGILQELEVIIPIGKSAGFTTNMKLHILVQGEEMFYIISSQLCSERISPHNCGKSRYGHVSVSMS